MTILRQGLTNFVMFVSFPLFVIFGSKSSVNDTNNDERIPFSDQFFEVFAARRDVEFCCLVSIGVPF